MRWCGGGKTRHDYEVVIQGGWDYMTNLGIKVTVGPKHHRTVQIGGVLRFKKGKGVIDRYSPCAPCGQPIPAVSRNGERPANTAGAWSIVPPVRRPAPVIQTQPRPAVTFAQPAARPVGGMSKAEQVRAFIREAKANGSGQDWVVIRAMTNLGMGRSMASKYVSENWARA